MHIPGYQKVLGGLPNTDTQLLTSSMCSKDTGIYITMLQLTFFVFDYQNEHSILFHSPRFYVEIDDSADFICALIH